MKSIDFYDFFRLYQLQISIALSQKVSTSVTVTLVHRAAHPPDTVSCLEDIILEEETIITSQWSLSMDVKYSPIYSKEITIGQ